MFDPVAHPYNTYSLSSSQRMDCYSIIEQMGGLDAYTASDDATTIVPDHHAKNVMMAWYKAEKRGRVEPDFSWDDWAEDDGDLNGKELYSLLYEMSTEANASN